MADPMAPETPMLPMPEEGTGSLAYWRNQATASQKRIQDIATQRKWDQNLQAYLGKGLTETPRKDTVVVNKDYTLVEGAKALLFFQTPDVSTVWNAPEYEQAAPLVATVINHYLQIMQAKTMVDEVLFDVLCPAGIGISKVGYECFVDPQEPELMVPSAINPMLPQMGPDGVTPVMEPKIVRERYFWERISPKRFLCPTTFIGSDFDKASWLGYTYDLDKVVAEKLYSLTPEEASNGANTPDPERTLLRSDISRATNSETTEKVTFTEICYRASDVDPTIGDPEIIRQLVFMDGRDTPVVHRDHPDQVISDGKRIGGIKGYPLRVLTLQYVSDEAIPPSDCSISREQVDELSIGRTQMIQQRDRALPLVMGDSTRLGDATAKIVAGEIQEIIMVPGMDLSNPPMVAISRGNWPRENFTFNDIINRDIAELWSMGPNQAGVDTDTRRTATELSIMQSATETRMDARRVRVLNWFSRSCEVLLALIQKYADDTQYARIVGPNGMPALTAWDKTDIAGDFSIVLAPDSSQRVDATADKKRAVDIFGMLGNDPLINPVELRKWLVRKLGMDAEKLVKAPEPKAPEQPQVSVSIKGEDLNPMMPQYANVSLLLAVGGIGLEPATGPLPPGQQPPQNPGGVPPVSPIGKRMDEGTGQLPGAGMAAQANV